MVQKATAVVAEEEQPAMIEAEKSMEVKEGENED
jgi:hypothetical protein